MRGKWAGSLGLALGIGLGSLHAEEVQWRPAATTATRPAATLGPPALLGRPVPMAPDHAIEDAHVLPTSYVGSGLPVAQTATLAPPQPTVVRGQNPDLSAPTLAPMPQGIPPTPQEQYNAGVVVTPPPAGSGSFGGWFGNCYDSCCEAFACNPCCPERKLFQSDHCFDGFISPVSNPFLFEDPRALTELRPVFIYQATPRDNWVFNGGNIEWFGVQGRVAFTDRLSLSMTKLGFIAQQPNRDIAGFDDEGGFSELWIGPKYTFIRNDRTGSLWAIGLQLQVATGPQRVFQDTDTLGLQPYISWAQNFWKTSYGSMNFMNTTGYAFGTDSLRSDYFFSAFHLDYNVLNANKFYPLVELNWRNYTGAGENTNLEFEGGDLYNFGSQGTSGHTDLSIAVGFRYKFSEAIQLGLANEFPLTGARDLLDYRLTFDMIFRY